MKEIKMHHRNKIFAGNIFSALLVIGLGFFNSLSVFAQAPEQDCFNAIKVCQSVYVQNKSYQGFGQKQELSSANNSCLSENETNSSWYIFTANTSGTLDLQINPSFANDDYDFAIFNLTHKTCESIVNDSLSPIRCNYSSSHGSTGLKSGFSGTSESSAGPNQCSPMIVNAGETYALVINNFTSTAGGYTLVFGGTASIFDNNAPILDSVSVVPCSPKTITLYFDENVQCSSIASDGSDFVLSGSGPNFITGASSTFCNSNSLTKSIVIKFNAPLVVTGTYKLTTVNGTDGNSILDMCGNVLQTGVSISFDVDFTSALVKISSFTDADCNMSNGTATATVSSGAFPYTYSWNTSPVQTTKKATDLLPGNYILTVTDNNGCKSLASVVISNKNAPEIKVLTTENLKCKNINTGSISIEVSKGTAPYTYLWNTKPTSSSSSITGLSSGTYIALVTDASGCKASVSVKITSPPEMIINLSQTSSACGKSDGTINTSVIGGVKPYSYFWSTDPATTTNYLTGLPAGIYKVTVSDDNNCKKSAQAFISNSNGPDGFIASSKNAYCDQANGAVTVNANGNGPFNFIWNTNPNQVGPTATDLLPSTYQVSIMDKKGCIQILNVKINNVPGPTAILSAITHASCGLPNGAATILPSGGTLPYQYFWSSNPADSMQTVTNLASGNYTSYVMDANGCKSPVLGFQVFEFGGMAKFACSLACEGEEVKLISKNTSKASKWGWDFGDPLSGSLNYSSDENPTHLFAEPGVYQVKLYTEGVCGKNTVGKSVVVNAKPSGYISSLPDEITVSSETFFKFNGTQLSSYLWDFGDGKTSESSFPKHVFMENGDRRISVKLTSPDGCTSVVTQNIDILPRPEIYVPSAFTPDNDGINDYFTVKGRGIEVIDFKIFDRWGGMVFFTDNVENAINLGWDGKNANVSVEGPVVFNYLIIGRFTNGVLFNKSGKVSLLP